MIIRSKEKINVNGKNKPVWVLDTDALTVTHNTPDAEPSLTEFSSDHIKYHLYYSAEYRPARLKKLVNDGTILSYLIDLDRAVAEAVERQVEKMLANIRSISELWQSVILQRREVWRTWIACVPESLCTQLWCMCDAMISP